MRICLESVTLRPIESKDIEALYTFRNDESIITSLGGFHTGYSRKDLDDWLEYHRKQNHEVLWTIANADSDDCLGHVGLYNIDHRVRKAELAILIGKTSLYGQGLGKQVCTAIISYGFKQLNLRRIELSLLVNNKRAMRLYKSLDFQVEGTQKDAQFRDGGYLDVVLMARLNEK